MSFSYTSPDLISLLILISFLFLLQVFRIIFQFIFNAGLLGEIVLGIIYSISNLLSLNQEISFQLIGYLGLILIVFESGLEFDSSLFISTLPVALLTASIGILLPISFTFALFHAFSFSPLAAFIVGSALSSTSLGTTIHVLKSIPTGEIMDNKLGSIIISGALIDDIISLVLWSVIQSLGNDHTTTSLGWTIGRAILAAVVLIVIVPLLVFGLVKPLLKRFKWESRVVLFSQEVLFSIGVIVLSGFLSIAYYAGTTILLGAYLAGVSLSLPSREIQTAFRKSYSQIESIQNYIFVPLFFASIGYSIPLSNSWTWKIVLRGFIYSILMSIGKLLAGSSILIAAIVARRQSQLKSDGIEESEIIGSSTRMEKVDNSTTSTLSSLSTSSSDQPNQHLLRSAVIVGTALIARGEIGILILQIAFNSSSSGNQNNLGEEEYLIGILAVLLCTLVGPVVFSRLVKK